MDKQIQWTESQKSAIEFTGNNLLVSAAAGSGKTAVMIERIFSLINSKQTSADRILVVTYTNAAAASMRGKLVARFESELKNNPDNEYLYRQKQLLDRADISTIHAFCQNLLRRYYFHTPLSPDFRIIDDTQQNLISEKAIEEILEEAAIKHENGLFDEYGDILDQFSSRTDDSGLKKAVLDLNGILLGMTDPEKFELLNEELYSSGERWREFLLAFIKEKCFLALQYTDEIKERYKFSECGGKILKDADCFADEFERIACETSFEKINEITSKRVQSFNQSKIVDDSTEYVKVRGALRKVRDTVKKISANINDVNDSAARAVKALFYLERSYSLRFDDYCFADGCVTFDGLLRITLELINSNEEIRNELKDNIDCIFVDEYQDANELQSSILENISRGDNLFFVGDVKQSIYGFQHASPELFLDKMRDYSSGVLGKRINLVNNFRSSAKILNAVNKVFRNCMFEDVTEIEYDADAELYPSRDAESPQNKRIFLNNGSPENEAEILFTDTNEISEEEAIAKRILSLMNCSVLNPATGESRMLTYGDIMILGLKNNFAANFEGVFKKYGIPFKASEKKTKESFDALGSVISLLRLLEVRRSDSDLIIVLLSVIGRFTSEELGIIRAQKKEGSFFDAFVSFNADAKIKAKIDAFLCELNRLELLQASMSLPDFITYVYNETGFVYSVAVTEDSFIQEENMNILISAARTYSENYSGGLRGFLRYYESIVFSDSPAAQINENDNSVHYMTMHKSKGLEFPVVILYNLSYSYESNKNIFRFSKSMGLAFKAQEKDEFGCRSSYDPVNVDAVKLENKRKDSSEKLRLLYVAMTRAKNKLIVSVAGKRTPISKNGSSLQDLIVLPSKLAASSFGTYASLIVPIIYFSPEGKQLKEWFEDGSVSSFAPENPIWTLVFSKKNENSENEKPLSSAEIFDAKQYLSKIEAALSWQYPYLSATSMRAKQNPSKSQEHTRMLLRSPMFDDAEYKGAQKGTVTHFFMEHFSFTSPLSVREQAENMLKCGLLSNEEFLSLPFEHLERFISSDFAARMRKAPVLYRERPFCKIIPLTKTDDEALMQGTVDCYFFEGDTIILLDYKTDVIRGDTEPYIARHRRQLLMYASALEELYPGKTVLPHIHFFSIDKTVKI